MHILLVGAGLSGAVIGRALAQAGHQITIVEARDHVAGNCHTARDGQTGIILRVWAGKEAITIAGVAGSVGVGG